MADEIFRSITTLGAVMLGFILGQTSEWFKSRRKAKKQRSSVRQLIRLETTNNVSHLINFRSSILEKEESWASDDGTFMYVKLADQASRVPFPPITMEAWRANLGEVASVYDETELERMWCLQRDLERLQALHLFFCEAQSERRTSSRHASSMHGHRVFGSMISGFGFSESVKEPAIEFKELMDRVAIFQVISD